MSTEHQKYSIHNQAAAIAEYAYTHGLAIVRTYADQGKSGLRMEGRPALTQLISDVTSGEPGFDTILVYDVSRWGRFQDSDESAYYEFLCAKTGIAVQYCAEQFENDGSLSATIFKNIKRVMAAEYSRELSVKVFRAQSRLVRLGYKLGGNAGYGLRRQLVDEHRKPKAILEPGQRKAVQRDRIILVPGPEKEIAVIGKIFRWFVNQRKSENEIAEILNSAGELNAAGRPWNRLGIHKILVGEKYIGNNIYNQRSFKLSKRRVCNPPDQWVRKEGAFEAVVPLRLFEAAQRRFAEKTERTSDREILRRLTVLLERNGHLSAEIIDDDQSVPSTSTYIYRFGSLAHAYELIGYSGGRDYGSRHGDGAVQNLLRTIRAEAIAQIRRGGGTVRKGSHWFELVINENLKIFVAAARRVHWNRPTVRYWKVLPARTHEVDFFLIAHTTVSNTNIEDYYLVPSKMIRTGCYFRLTERRRFELNPYRHHTLQFLATLATLASRTPRFNLEKK